MGWGMIVCGLSISCRLRGVVSYVLRIFLFVESSILAFFLKFFSVFLSCTRDSSRSSRDLNHLRVAYCHTLARLVAIITTTCYRIRRTTAVP